MQCIAMVGGREWIDLAAVYFSPLRPHYHAPSLPFIASVLCFHCTKMFSLQLHQTVFLLQQWDEVNWAEMNVMHVDF